MNNTMTHRGPDDEGVMLCGTPDGYLLGMAHRRLAILDLSEQGHQPMQSPDGRLTIVYNGEIYNFRELRKELKDYPFRSECDTEVILAAYLAWGEACVSHFNGMFAFALYDRQEQMLMLARDRAGQKPLYYHPLDGDFENGVAFASELKPIMQLPGFRGSVRRDVLARFLYQQYINAPETVLEDVYKLEPGCVLTFRDGKTQQSRYWDPCEVSSRMRKDPVKDPEEALSGLEQLLYQSVQRRMIADVPLGTFLSGGYDSSLITALAQRALGTVPVKTFCIGFEEEAYDESGYAAAIAEHLGCEHTQMTISEQDMLALVASIPQYFDEPMADSSQIPTMLVSKLAAQSVTVALSGDAGDELFCGYNVYDMIRRAQLLDPAGAAAHALGRIGNLEARYPLAVRIISANRDPRTKTQFGEGSYGAQARRLVKAGGDMLPVNYPWEDKYHLDNWQARRMLLDLDTYLPGDILAKVDRASMKYSLENRCPLLDVDVMEYSFRLDHSLKYRNGEKKWILRRLAWKYLPKELLERPKKGFSVPLDKWLRGPLRQQLESYADRDFIVRQGLFDPQEVQRLTESFLRTGDAGRSTGRNYSWLCWSYFVFQQWAEHWKIGG